MPEKSRRDRPSGRNREELESIGRGEAWFAKIDREFEQHSALDLQSARDNQRIAHRVADHGVRSSERLQVIAERALSNAVTFDSERSERVNMHNIGTIENINQQNDTLFLLLAEALKSDGEATITISRPKKAATTAASK